MYAVILLDILGFIILIFWGETKVEHTEDLKSTEIDFKM